MRRGAPAGASCVWHSISRPLRGGQLDQVLAAHLAALGLDGADQDPQARREALATAALITGGNFRLIGRLFSQVARILEINGLSALTSEVVETARRSLVIGPD